MFESLTGDRCHGKILAEQPDQRARSDMVPDATEPGPQPSVATRSIASLVPKCLLRHSEPNAGRRSQGSGETDLLHKFCPVVDLVVEEFLQLGRRRAFQWLKTDLGDLLFDFRHCADGTEFC